MKTTETVQELGLYSSECCGVEATFDSGDTFSRCPRCQQLCIWELEDESVTTEDLAEPDDGVAA
jgi:hypothetical protein